jgi:hypothetical protein
MKLINATRWHRMNWYGAACRVDGADTKGRFLRVIIFTYKYKTLLSKRNHRFRFCDVQYEVLRASGMSLQRRRTGAQKSRDINPELLKQEGKVWNTLI